jgi:hypothetical protein
MTPVERVLAKLPGARPSGRGWSARCPAHEDRKASLSVAAGDDGRALVKCHAGCFVQDVVVAVGLTVSDLMPDRADPIPHLDGGHKPAGRTYPTADAALADLERRLGPRSALWTYHDAVGNPVGLVVRWDGPKGKDIRPVSRHPDGWRIGALPDPRPLYRLPELAKADRVLVCEGEKAADAARSLGFTATTSAGGSQAAGKADWSPLAGKVVWILPDNDRPGRKYADAVAGILATLAPAPVVKMVELPGLGEGGDVVDWIDAHGDAAEPESMRAELETIAAAADPETAPADDTRFRPFPVTALPAPAREFVAAGAKAIGCDPSYLALPLLVALAAAVGNTRRLMLKRGWFAPAIIWAVVIGESGTAKTPAFRLVMRPVRRRQERALERYVEEMKRYQVELARWEKDFAAWKRSRNAAGDPPEKPEPPRAVRYVVSDTTVEALAPILLANPRGLLLARDELAGWFGSFDRYAGKGKAGSDAANWLSMFSAETVTVDRKTGTPPTIYVPHAAVCVTGGIQPGILQKALGQEHRESGLAARPLLAYPPRRVKKWTEADIDPAAEARLVELFDRLYDLEPDADDEGNPQPGVVRLSPDAKAAWTAYYDAHAVEQADLTGDLAAAWAKLEEYAARLALVVHLTRWAGGDPTLRNVENLDAASMAAGITLTEWFKGEARRVYAMLAETEPERDTRRLVEWIGRKGGSVTARQAQQGCRWLKAPGAAEDALGALVKAGRGRWEYVGPAPKGGCPTRTFTLSTPSPPHETPATDVEEVGSVDVDNVDATGAHPAPPADPTDRLFPDSRGRPD